MKTYILPIQLALQGCAPRYRNVRLLGFGTLLLLLQAGVRGEIDQTGNVDPPIPATGIAADNTRVGNSAAGSVTVRNGSTLTAKKNLTLGAQANIQGTLTIQDNNSKVEVAENHIVGENGKGKVTQNAGATHTVQNNLTLGDRDGSEGTYEMNDGKLEVKGTTYIGLEGKGIFTQKAGDNLAGTLTLGAQAKGDGTYTLNGGKLESAETTVGQAAKGSFTQNNGEHTVKGTLSLGNLPTGEGKYELNDGKLNTGLHTYVGNEGSGVFDQWGGTHTVADTLSLGEGNNSTGNEYNFYGGNLKVGGLTVVGHGANSGGALYLGGGTLETKLFTLGENTGSSGDFLMNNGKIVVKETAIVGGAGSGDYFLLGGTTDFQGDLSVGEKASGDVRLYGKDAKLNVAKEVKVGTQTGVGYLELGGGAKADLKGKLLLGGVGKKGSGSADVQGENSVLKAVQVEVGGAAGLNTGKLTIGDKGSVDAVVNVQKTGVLEGKKGVKDAKKLNNLGGKVVAAPGAFNIGDGYAQLSGGGLEILFQSNGAGGLDWGHLFSVSDATFESGVPMIFNFQGVAPQAGDTFEFLTGSHLYLSTGATLLPNEFNCRDGIFDCEIIGLAPGFDFEVLSTTTSLILKAHTTGTSVPDGDSGFSLCLGLALVLAAHRRINARGRQQIRMIW